MPLLAGGLVVVTPDVEAPAEATVAYFESAGLPSFSWVDPDGTEWPLSNHSEDVGWFTITGPSGWGAAPIEFAADSLPRGGESIRFIQEQASSIQWPMEIFGRDHEEFVQRWETIGRAFKLTTRRKMPGRLRVQRPNGRVREAFCFYETGLGGEPGQNHLYARPVITFRCPEGKWRDVEPIEREFSFTPTTGGDGGGVVGFFSPYLSLSSGKVVGPGAQTDPADPDAVADEDDPVVVNPGDAEAWPVWTITGPLTQLRARSKTLDTRFSLTYDLGEQQTITITTEHPTVRGPGDANLSKYIDWFNPEGAELWPLADGPNAIDIEVDGAGPTTSVRLAFTPRFDGA